MMGGICEQISAELEGQEVSGKLIARMLILIVSLIDYFRPAPERMM